MGISATANEQVTLMSLRYCGISRFHYTSIRNSYGERRLPPVVKSSRRHDGSCGSVNEARWTFSQSQSERPGGMVVAPVRFIPTDASAAARGRYSERLAPPRTIAAAWGAMEERSSARADFLSTVAHELRT